MDRQGVANIMVTPFTPDEEVDVDSIGRVTRWAIDKGVDALVPLGIMGEAHKLTDDERDTVLDAVVTSAEGHVPVVAGCTAESTLATITRVRRAEAAGAAAVMVAPPRAALTPDLQQSHYAAVAAATSLPIVLQDEPVTTGVKLLAGTIGAIGEDVGITITKVEEAPSPTKVSAILAANPNIACFGGLGGLYMLEELNRGATGIMTGFGYPELLVQILREYQAGHMDAARETFFRYLPLIRYEAQLGVGGVAIRKHLLKQRGVIAFDTARRPVATGDPRAADELAMLTRALGLS